MDSRILPSRLGRSAATRPERVELQSTAEPTETRIELTPRLSSHGPGRLRRRVLRWATALVIGGAGGACVSHTDRAASAHELLVAEFTRHYQGTPATGQLADAAADSIRLTAVSSQAVPGLVYTQGAYTPPQSADASVWDNAAELGGESTLLHTPTDWIRLVAPAKWFPSSASGAVTACSEIIAWAGPHRTFETRTLVYRDTSTFHGAPSKSVPMAAEFIPYLAKTIQPPIARKGANTWEVNLWAVELYRTTRYDCRISRNDREGLRLNLAETDSLPGVGMLVAPPESLWKRR